MLGRLKARTQHRKVRLPHCGLCAQARVQGFLAVLSIAAVDDVPLLGGDLGAQLPKLLFVLAEVFAHAVRGTVAGSITRAGRILSHWRRDCRAHHRRTSTRN
jgi:hypothetical protein